MPEPINRIIASPLIYPQTMTKALPTEHLRCSKQSGCYLHTKKVYSTSEIGTCRSTYLYNQSINLLSRSLSNMFNRNIFGQWKNNNRGLNKNVVGSLLIVRWIVMTHVLMIFIRFRIRFFRISCSFALTIRTCPAIHLVAHRLTSESRWIIFPCIASMLDGSMMFKCLFHHHHVNRVD